MPGRDRAPAGGSAGTRGPNKRGDRVARLIVLVDVDTTRRSPRELCEHARDAWLTAVDRARAAGRIDLAVAEELRRAWPPAEVRR